ncbi:hypothetical protein [Chromobacterium haemolyticum]|uniref:hypothetical protein n=1 Tax=Chromobacterium TaxID=535 RepID=UPI004056BB85
MQLWLHGMFQTSHLNGVVVKKIILLTVLIGCAVVAACAYLSEGKEKEKGKMDYPEKISIALNQGGVDWKNKYGDIVHVNAQPAGVNFYKIQPLCTKQSIVVRLEHGSHSLEIPRVLSVTGTQDMDKKEGIDSIQLSAGLSSQSSIEHDVARRYVWNLVKSIRAAGWQKYIEETDPRLSGKAAYEYAVQKHGALDPDYELSLTEWMTMPARTRWSFYAKDAFLSLEFDRDMQRMDPAKPGAYLLNVSISSAEQQFSSNFEFEERDHWRSLWDAAARKWKQERNIKEAQLRAQGVAIDIGYQDPPLPAEPVGK